MPREPFYSEEPDLKAATEAASGHSVYLVRMSYWDGAAQQEALFTDAPVDLSVDIGAGAETWVGTGLMTNVSDVTDGADMDEGGIDISFDGVNQTVIAILMQNQFRGQPVEIYKAWFNESDGSVAGTPALIFKGYQLDAYSIGETSTDNPDAVSVTTRATNRLTKLRNENLTLTNPQSHLNYLQRAGLADTTANFWTLVPEIIGTEQYWGKSNPQFVADWWDRTGQRVGLA
jgi:hypothetical protein